MFIVIPIIGRLGIYQSLYQERMYSLRNPKANIFLTKRGYIFILLNQFNVDR